MNFEDGKILNSWRKENKKHVFIYKIIIEIIIKYLLKSKDKKYTTKKLLKK